MIDQIFSLSDIPRVFTLALLEMLLSADNAIILGVVSHSLPPALRRRALFIGIISAFVLRFGVLVSLSYFFTSKWLQVLGGAYLIYLSIRYFTKKRKAPVFQPIGSFWKTVFVIELLDLVFALDSMLAGVAFIDAVFSKIWVVYLGGILGLFGIRWAANLFSSLLTRFPRLEQSAYLIVGWVGIKLGLLAFHFIIPPPLFWAGLLLFFLSAFIGRKR